MPKVKISEYSATANSNTDVASINIDEGCAPSGINNAIRAIMGHLKDFQQGTNGDPFNGPVNGTLGATTPSTVAATTLTTSSTVTHNGGTANGVAYLNGSKVLTTGSALVFDGSNLGVGVTPSAWSNYKAIQMGNGVGLASYTAGAIILNLGTNQYYNGTNYVYVNTDFAASYQQAFGIHKWFTAPSGTAGNAITFTQAMTLDASGNLGIGTTSPSTYGKFVTYSSGGYFSVDTSGQVISAQLLDVATAGGRFTGYSSRGALGAIHIEQATTSADGGYMTFRTCASGSTSTTERARIDSSGNLLVGTTNASGTAGIGFKFLPSATYSRTNQVGSTTSNSDTTHEVYSTGASAYRFYVGYGGTVFATNTTISAISDIRFKENIRDLDAGLSEVLALKPRLYDWKEGKGANIKNARGFIAQEFETVFPDLIDEWKDEAPEGEDPYKSVRQDLIPVLVKAIQEQSALITQLQADVALLKGA